VTRQLKIVLGDDLREWLDKATAITGNSLAEEIRQRLEVSFLRDATDPVTQELVDFVRRLDEQLRIETGYRWHRHVGVTEAFATAVWVRARRLIAGGVASIRVGNRERDSAQDDAFEVNTEPFQGKKITTEDEQREYGRMVEWIDARVYQLASPFGASGTSRVNPTQGADAEPSVRSTADDLPVPKEKQRRK
jgi:hypothetical protein